MSNKFNHIKNTAKDFLRYTENKMSDLERNAFEKSLQKDSFDAEALEGLQSLSPEEIRADISEMNKRLFHKPDSSDRFTLYRYAAGIAALVAISTIFFVMLDRKISSQQKPTILTETSSEIKEDKKLLPATENQIYQVPAAQVQKPAPKENPISKIIPQTNADELPVQIESHQNISKSDDSEVLASRVAEKTLADSDEVIVLADTPALDTAVNLQSNHIGMEDLEITTKAKKDFNSVMNPSKEDLEEVTVVGYGSKQNSRKKVLAENTKGIPAEPVEGLKNFDDYIVEYQNFPLTESYFSDVKVILEFLVDNSGQPYDIKVIMMFPCDSSGRPNLNKDSESPGREFSDEATRLLENGPKWKAASPTTFKTRIIITLSKK